jgi:hypothetical protein
MNTGIDMIWDTLDTVSPQKPVEHNKFCGMSKQDGLRYFSGDYRLMLKTIFALGLHISNGIIKRRNGTEEKKDEISIQ